MQVVHLVTLPSINGLSLFQLLLRQRLARDDAEPDRAGVRHRDPLPLLCHLGRDLPDRRQEHRPRVVLILGTQSDPRRSMQLQMWESCYSIHRISTVDHII